MSMLEPSGVGEDIITKVQPVSGVVPDIPPGAVTPVRFTWRGEKVCPLGLVGAGRLDSLRLPTIATGGAFALLDLRTEPVYRLMTSIAQTREQSQFIGIFSDSLELRVKSALLIKLWALQNTPEEDRFPGADWPTDQAFAEATVFIGTFPHNIPMPDMGLGNDGEINFLWEYEGVEIDLGLYGTQTYSYYACGGKDGKEYLCNRAPIEDGLTDDLQKILMS